jgi:hypothetical protein
MSNQVLTNIHTFLNSWARQWPVSWRPVKFSGRAGPWLKWGLPLLAGLLLLLGSNVASSNATVIPTISITSVTTDQSVTIQTHNFPANQTFTVRMGEMGTLGIGGIVVASTPSGSGGSFTATYDIPQELQGRHRIAIRLESPQGYFSYNWFNNSSPPPAAPVHTGIPTFRIEAVTVNQNVTIVTNNFPPNRTFTVTMGPPHTQGIGGTVVGTIESGEGGTLTRSFDIPQALHGQSRISIRAQTAGVNPYFAYNWFHNSTATGADPGTGTGGGTVTPTTGIPTFRICTVTRDGNVTIETRNFPPNQTFTVTMGQMFTRGVGGPQAGTLQSGQGGTARHTFDIPASLHGQSRIAIRAQTGHANPYFAYNWFHNSSTTSDFCGG